MRKDLAAALLRIISGVRPISADACPAGPAVFFANHSSHLDFATIWAALPGAVRERTRPVAGRDYWEKTRLRRHIAGDFFRALLIERQRVSVANNPLQPMLDALDGGDALIVFPEGTRSADGTLGAFKPGLYHLARNRPRLPFVPVFLQHLNRILPKGDILPVPIIAHLSTGEPLHLADGETKGDFLERARTALVALGTDS